MWRERASRVLYSWCRWLKWNQSPVLSPSLTFLWHLMKCVKGTNGGRPCGIELNFIEFYWLSSYLWLPDIYQVRKNRPQCINITTSQILWYQLVFKGTKWVRNIYRILQKTDRHPDTKPIMIAVTPWPAWKVSNISTKRMPFVFKFPTTKNIQIDDPRKREDTLIIGQITITSFVENNNWNSAVCQTLSKTLSIYWT